MRANTTGSSVRERRARPTSTERGCARGSRCADRVQSCCRSCGRSNREANRPDESTRHDADVADDDCEGAAEAAAAAGAEADDGDSEAAATGDADAGVDGLAASLRGLASRLMIALYQSKCGADRN